MYVSAELFWTALAVVLAGFSTTGGAFMWLGDLRRRVSNMERQMSERVDERQGEREDRERDRRDFNIVAGALRGEMKILNDNIAQAREDALGRFAPMVDARRRDERIEALNGRVGALETGQAELRITTKAILESVGDIKRAVERRSPSS